MKVAVVYNRESQNVINLFGTPNKEKIGLKTIKRLTDALKQHGHQVIAVEGDKDLVDRLEEFMPRVVKGERPGMVFNVSYGIQGQARYTHVPSILEMVGIPYVGSGPLAHSLALDKVVTKMILRQHGLPTPDFVVLDHPEMELPPLRYPMIVKPKNEAVSFGLRIVKNEKELREGVHAIFQEYSQPVLAEQYIDGREVNVGLIGNNPPEVLPPVELVFGRGGPKVYTYEDKTGRSGRTISHKCPAPIGVKRLDEARQIAVRAFTALGCADCARVDMRLDKKGNIYILEINSLPSLGEHGSYLIGAAHIGLDFPAVINRLVEVASARYFGTPEPPKLAADPKDAPSQAFAVITKGRDQMEKRLREWTALSSRTDDPLGLQEAVRRMHKLAGELGMKPVRSFTDERVVWTWETPAGMTDGTLFVGHLDSPADQWMPIQRFRREPEWLFGEGIGTTRAPLVMLETVLRSLRTMRCLRSLPVGMLFYTDEGRDARYSREIIHNAAGAAKRVVVIRPGHVGDAVVTQRRGQRKYRIRFEGEPLRPGRPTKKAEPLRYLWNSLEKMAGLSSQQERVSVSVIDIRAERSSLRLPHRAEATILVTFPDAQKADQIEKQMLAVPDKKLVRWELELISDRPPMAERRASAALGRALSRVARQWEIPLKRESSTLPSVAGLVPAKTACICGVGPVAHDLGTPHESVLRISLIQRTLLLTQFLAGELEKK